MTEPIDMNAPLSQINASTSGVHLGTPRLELLVPMGHGGYCSMTLAHLVAVLAAITPEQQQAVWKATLPPIRMLADDYTDAEADRILAMTDEEMDAEIRAAGEDPASVRKWSKATGRWCSLLAQSTARTAEEKARADRAEQALAVAHDVLRAAVAWWRKKRPLSFTQSEHLANPTINTTTEAEERLAEAAARCVDQETSDV